MTFLGIFPCEVKDIFFAWSGACKSDWNKHQKSWKTHKNPKFSFGWRAHLVTIFDQFTFFRYSTLWTVSKRSSGTIKGKISKHSLSFIAQYHQRIYEHCSSTAQIIFGCNLCWTLSKHLIDVSFTCEKFLRFTSGATPAVLPVAEPFWPSYV